RYPPPKSYRRSGSSFRIKEVHQQSASQFGFKPGRFRRHEKARIRHGNELIDRGWIHGERQFRLPGVYEPLKLFYASNAADEIDVGIAAWICDSELRAEYKLAQACYIQVISNRISLRLGQPERVPCPVQVKADGTALLRSGLTGSFVHIETLFQTIQERLRRHREHSHDPVVGQDPHLLHGKEHCWKEFELPVLPAILRPQFRGRATRRFAAMVSIGYVESVDVCEQRDQPIGIGCSPEDVADAVLEGYVVDWLGLHNPSYQLIDLADGAVGQHHRLGVRPLGQNVTGPILLFRRTGLLVLEDAILVVVGDRYTTENAGLCPPIHHQSVYIDGGDVLHDRVLTPTKCFKIFSPLGIDGIIVLVGALREIDLGANHVQKAPRLPFRKASCLLRIYYVIRNARDLLNHGRCGAECAKGMKMCHRTRWHRT